jgi:hypothetical protein
MLLIMHRVCRPALPAALLLIGMSAMGITDAAAQGSPEARQACTPDAMRLCSEFTSDVSQTTKCMMAKQGAVERGVPDGDGTRDFPPRALLSALQTLHARLLPLISLSPAGAQARAGQLICCAMVPESPECDCWG